MQGSEIRDKFQSFFEERGHLRVSSASLIPSGDPTLLFTSAGMVPFKQYFMGEETPPSRRLTSCQKSFRTADIEEVGDHKHLTFFEMLGNFSIGDYFKEDAIAFAWELVTETFGLPADRLYVTIHLDDDEAYGIWRGQIRVPPERIYRYGDKDNWWGPAGAEGPTGPCSEIHYDGGAEKGCHNGRMVAVDTLTGLLRQERDGASPQPVPGCHPNCDCERFVELWNLVFMQFYQDAAGNRTPLPAPSVDTGMGLERAAVILQGKNNVYETDLFQPIIAQVSALCGHPYGAAPETDYAIRVVAEHARAAAFLIADGVIPGNEGRSYVLRRMIRRAIRYGHRLEVAGPFVSEVVPEVVGHFKSAYPDLADNPEAMRRVVANEETQFAEACQRGEFLLTDKQHGICAIRDELIKKIGVDAEDRFFTEVLAYYVTEPLPPGVMVSETAGEIMAGYVSDANSRVQPMIRPYFYDKVTRPLLAVIADNKINSTQALKIIHEKAEAIIKAPLDSEVFFLYDTFGFPPEVTLEIAHEYGLEVDMDWFEREMAARRAQSRATAAFSGAMAIEELPEGGSQFARDSLVLPNAVVVMRSAGPVSDDTDGRQFRIELDRTPFYPEGGGQLGDTGYLQGPNGRCRVTDTQSPRAGRIFLHCLAEEGDIQAGDAVVAEVDAGRRRAASRNHSATHLLHAALRATLGAHVRQAGSLVAPERLRFDFSHFGALSRDELLAVQSLANEKVRANLPVQAAETTYPEAVRQGALAFFGDRYGETVRVVTMAEDAGAAPFSMEVCGGTHLGATGEVGTLLVLGESSIGGGMRRIEALTGPAAEELFIEQSDRLARLAQRLQTPPAELESRLDSYMQETEELRRRLAATTRAALRAEAEALLTQAADVEGVKVVCGRTSATAADGLREMGDFLRDKLGSVAVMLGGVDDGGRPLLVAMVTADLVERGVHAGALARETAQIMGGGGGGRPDMAQAGGRDAAKLDEALAGVPARVRAALAA